MKQDIPDVQIGDEYNENWKQAKKRWNEDSWKKSVAQSKLILEYDKKHDKGF